ncbi:MAG: DUF2808 domain-containing protein [Cyanobacteria bacterium P01_D01_bin.1]
MNKLSILLLTFGVVLAGSTRLLRESAFAQQTSEPQLELLRLADTRVTNNWQYRDANYLFNISIPQDSIAPIQKIVFQQIEGADYPSYSTRKSYVFEGGDRNQKIASSSVANDTDARTVTVTFDPPLQSGREITVVLNAFRNPRDGIYIYQVAGLPIGEDSQLRRLGTARLSFYQSSGRDRRYH